MIYIDHYLRSIEWRLRGCNNRELKQWRQRRRGQRLMKNEFIFYSRISRLSRCIQCNCRFKNWLKLNMWTRAFNSKKKKSKINRRGSRCPEYAELGHFTLLVCRERLRNVPRLQNARAELLFCSLNLLFGDVLVAVAVAVVVCLSSLIPLTSGVAF